MGDIRFGCLDVWVDEIVPCLRDTVTGELLETVVFKIESKKYLSSFRQDNGWHIDWLRVPNDVEVFALALRDTNEIEGLVGVRDDAASHAAYIHWACVAPRNNKHDFGSKRYVGVGGHLFAIAVDKSRTWGYEGVVHGFAANEKLLEHYIDVFHA